MSTVSTATTAATAERGGSVRRGSLMSYLEPIGAVIILQLFSVFAALAVVTAAPAVVAVRLGVRDVQDGDTTVTPRAFVLDTGRAFVRWWPLWLACLPVAGAWTLALLFWIAQPAPVSWVAAGALCAIGGLAAATMLGALAATTRAELDSPRTGACRDLLRRGFEMVQSKPLRAAASVVVFASWILLVMRLPTVLLVGSAAVPALIAVRLAAVTPTATSPATRT